MCAQLGLGGGDRGWSRRCLVHLQPLHRGHGQATRVAKSPGGAAWTAGNALLLLVVAASAALRYLGNDVAAEAVAWVVPVFEFVLAAEIVLNFVLWLYRPRIPGEAPRAYV